MIDIQARQHLLSEQATDEASRKYSDSPRERIVSLYEALITSCRESVTFIQQCITDDTRIRDAHSEDLELGQILWDNITVQNQIIKHLYRLIEEYREIIRNAGKR